MARECQTAAPSVDPTPQSAFTLDDLRTVLMVVGLIFGIDAESRIDDVARTLRLRA